MKIKIEIQGREIELSPEEARRIHEQLAEVFETKPTPSWPSLQPIIQPVIVPINREQEPWHTPKWLNTGRDRFAPPYDITCGNFAIGESRCEAKVG